MRLIFTYIIFYIDFFIHSTILGKSYYELQVIRFNKRYEGTYLLWCDQESKEYFISDHTFYYLNQIHIVKLVKDNKEVESKVFPFEMGKIISTPKAIELFNKSYLIQIVPHTEEIYCYQQIIKNINEQEFRILVRLLMVKVNINYKYIILANTLKDMKVITYNKYQFTI